MTVDCFFHMIALDKKVKNGQLRLVLLRELGHGIIFDSVNLLLLRETLESIRN